MDISDKRILSESQAEKVFTGKIAMEDMTRAELQYWARGKEKYGGPGDPNMLAVVALIKAGKFKPKM